MQLLQAGTTKLLILINAQCKFQIQNRPLADDERQAHSFIFHQGFLDLATSFISWKYSIEVKPQWVGELHTKRMIKTFQKPKLQKLLHVDSCCDHLINMQD